MTGEVTLTGKILPIGGLKEKTIAAQRVGVKYVFFPEANKKDWIEMNKEIKEGLIPFPVENYEQVYDIAFEARPLEELI